MDVHFDKKLGELSTMYTQILLSFHHERTGGLQLLNREKYCRFSRPGESLDLRDRIKEKGKMRKVNELGKSAVSGETIPLHTSSLVSARHSTRCLHNNLTQDP